MSAAPQTGADRAGGGTVRDAVRALEDQLDRGGVDDAQAIAEWTLAVVQGVGRAELRTAWKRPLSAAGRKAVDAAARRLLRHEPLQYVLGRAEFLGRPFACDRRALIPRPETEELALAVLRHAIPDSGSIARVADVGTGSGCLAVSLALERTSIELIATDIDPDALELARENARRHGVERRIRFVCRDLLGPASRQDLDVIVSNPPYVERGAIAGLAPRVRDYEPRRALDGGPDGLDVIRRLIAEAARALVPGGELWVEIGASQGLAVRALLAARGYGDIRVLRDLAGHDRIAAGLRPRSGGAGAAARAASRGRDVARRP